MKIDNKIIKNAVSESNKLFFETYNVWQKANGDDLFVNDKNYSDMANFINNQEKLDNIPIVAIKRMNMYKLKGIQEMRETEPDKKYKMFADIHQYVYNCYRTYFLAELFHREMFTSKKVLKLFRKIKIDINLTEVQLNEFVNNLLEV